jgi:hypothetical protein
LGGDSGHYQRSDTDAIRGSIAVEFWYAGSISMIDRDFPKFAALVALREEESMVLEDKNLWCPMVQQLLVQT